MGLSKETMSSSKSKSQGDNSPSEKIERKQHLPTHLVQDLISLMRIRDFLSLFLTYPMRIGNESKLKKWITDVSEFSANYSAQWALLNAANDDSFWKSVELLLSRRPLRWVEGLIPEDIIREVRNGGRLIFNERKSEELTTTTSSTSKEKQLKQVPEPILYLATRLAVEQLFQTLTSEKRSYSFQIFTEGNSSKHNIQNVRLSTRNDAEKRAVVGKIKAAFQFDMTFQRVLVIGCSKCQSDKEVQLKQVARRLEQMTRTTLKTKDGNVLLTRKTERHKKVMSKRHKMVMSKRHRQLVLLVDGDGDKKLDLQMVGLPKRRDSADVVVFITTESSEKNNDELTMAMNLEIRTENHVLPWEVFCKNVGSEVVSSSSAIQRIAVEIVKECGGHLLAIVLVAKSLKNVEDVKLWKLVLDKLRYPNISYNISGFDGVSKVMVNAFINIIWGDVTFETEKPHLRCSLSVFKRQHVLMGNDELFKYWFSEQVVNSQEEAEHTLRELVDRSVLLQFEGTQGRYILLPLEISNILESLLNKNLCKNLKKGGLGLTKPPKVWHWHGATQIELMHNQISELPPSPNCPKLEVLFLHGNAYLTEIPTLFFQHMPLLQVLDLSYTGIQGLPSSIFKSAQLKTLYLRGCKQFKQLPPEIVQLQNLDKLDLDGTPITHLPLSPNFPKLRSLSLQGNPDLMELPSSFFNYMPLLSILHLSFTSLPDLPSSFYNLKKLREFYLKGCELFMELPPEVGRLKNLKKLDLDGTDIIHLPREIQELTNLESLSLSFSGFHHNSGRGRKCMPYSRSAMIPLGFISQLTHLEYLRIDVNPDNEWWHNNVEHILAEIVGLKKLRTLELYVPEVRLLKLIPSRVSRCRFIVGHHMQRIISRAPPAVEAKFKQSNQSLRFINGVDFPNEMKIILPFVHAFFLDRHMTINHLSQFGLKNLMLLRSCILAECNEMQTIVDGEDSCLYGFLYLEFLTIFYMKNLRSIVQGPTPPRYSFSQLKFLALHTCPELTTIFTVNFLDNLSNLEELIVEDCPKVCSIVSHQTSEPITRIFLPSLRKLSLLYLPKLVSISHGLHIGRSLEKVGFYFCPKLEGLSINELSSKKLKVIRGEIKWWEALKWSEAEWGQKGCPDNFNHIFSRINEEVDVLTQLTTDEVESSSSNEERDSERRGVLAVTAKGRTPRSRPILATPLSRWKVKKAANGLKKPEIRKERGLLGVQKKVRVLSRLVPGCRKVPIPSLLEEANDYISALEIQVRAMTALADLLADRPGSNQLG